MTVDNDYIFISFFNYIIYIAFLNQLIYVSYILRWLLLGFSYWCHHGFKIQMDLIDRIGSIVIEWTNQFHSVIGSIKSSACRNPVWRGQVVGWNLNLNENERGKGHETNTTHIWASFAAVGLEPSPSSGAVEPTAICGRGTAVEPAHAPLLLLQSATFSAS